MANSIISLKNVAAPNLQESEVAGDLFKRAFAGIASAGAQVTDNYNKELDRRSDMDIALGKIKAKAEQDAAANPPMDLRSILIGGSTAPEAAPAAQNTPDEAANTPNPVLSTEDAMDSIAMGLNPINLVGLTKKADPEQTTTAERIADPSLPGATHIFSKKEALKDQELLAQRAAHTPGVDTSVDADGNPVMGDDGFLPSDTRTPAQKALEQTIQESNSSVANIDSLKKLAAEGKLTKKGNQLVTTDSLNNINNKNNTYTLAPEVEEELKDFVVPVTNKNASYSSYPGDAANASDKAGFVRQITNKVVADPLQAAEMRALIRVESNNTQDAVSNKQAKGFAQLLDSTGADPGKGVTPVKNNSPEENIRVGSDYFQALKKKYKGDVTKALAAYNHGDGNVDKLIAAGNFPEGLPAETKTHGNRWKKAFNHIAAEEGLNTGAAQVASTGPAGTALNSAVANTGDTKREQKKSALTDALVKAASTNEAALSAAWDKMVAGENIKESEIKLLDESLDGGIIQLKDMLINKNPNVWNETAQNLIKTKYPNAREKDRQSINEDLEKAYKETITGRIDALEDFKERLTEKSKSDYAKKKSIEDDMDEITSAKVVDHYSNWVSKDDHGPRKSILKLHNDVLQKHPNIPLGQVKRAVSSALATMNYNTSDVLSLLNWSSTKLRELVQKSLNVADLIE